ncbi:MAG TPA: DUF2092 domain-containing protein [Kofleriaceae bacterium]|nr:DUF2092 domain-containing protein [Kofleriaceae bacterium]
MLASLSVITAATVAAAAPQQRPSSNEPPSRSRTEREAEGRSAPRRDPKAVAVLDRMSRSLQGLTRYELDARTSTDLLVDEDMKVQRNATAQFDVKRPDGLRATVSSDRGTYQLFYDGRRLTVYDPARKFYATMAAPRTLRETVAAADAKEIELPLADFLVAATGEELLADVTDVGYLGPSRVGGAVTDHIAVRQPDVDWQVWVDRQTGLPRKYVITTKTDPTAPQFIAELDWNTSPPRQSDAQFGFRPPPDARQIPFATAMEQRDANQPRRGGAR